MSIEFTAHDKNHTVQVKFIPALLPEAKKPFNLRAAHQPVVDVHGIASKAEVYNIGTSPHVVEEGLTAALNIIRYLAADGYRIATPLFTLTLHIPGEYDGSETGLEEGCFPQARIRASAPFKKYLKEKVRLEFGGKDLREGIIGSACDEATERINETATIGRIIAIHGRALKIEADAAHRDQAGLYFEDSAGPPVKAELVAVNHPRTLKAVVPAGLAPGAAYTLCVRTQGSVKGHGTLRKELREIRSEFTLTAC
jgi:hypothetical protein